MLAIKAKNLSYKIPDEKEWILKDINFELNSNEILGIIGPNGGGKSTLLKLIVGLLSPTEGTIEYSKEFIGKPGSIGYVPQLLNLNKFLPITALEYLNFQAEALNLENAKNEINRVLDILEIKEKRNFLFKDMSGGEKQRILLAKALLFNPFLVVLDEPTTGLDSKGQDQLLQIIDQLKTELQSAVIIVDHNLNQILKKSDKVLCLNRTSHWHNHRDLLTKNVLEDIYHCELEHLLIHENDVIKGVDHHHHHQFCQHDHHETHSPKHPFIRRKN